MGQKVHPYGFRLGYNKTWKSRWFAKKEYADLLHEDLKLKKRLKDQLKAAGVASIEATSLRLQFTLRGPASSSDARVRKLTASGRKFRSARAVKFCRLIFRKCIVRN